MYVAQRITIYSSCLGERAGYSKLLVFRCLSKVMSVLRIHLVLYFVYFLLCCLDLILVRSFISVWHQCYLGLYVSNVRAVETLVQLKVSSVS